MTGQPEPSRDDLEREKLRWEIDVLRLETERKSLETRKLKAEIENLERQAGRTPFGRFLRDIAPHAVPVTALVAVVVSIVSLALTYSATVENRKLEEFHGIVSAFSATAPSARAGSAVLLGQVGKDGNDQRRIQARNLLLAGLGAEPDFNVRGAIEIALVSIGPGVVAELREKRRNIARELGIAFGRGPRPKCSSYSDKELSRLHSLQEGLITLAKVMAKIGNKPLDLSALPFRCALLLGIDADGAQLQRSVFWQADFSGAVLRNADFSDAQLDEADFFETEIHGAKFCGSQLTGLTTGMVTAARGWESAYFARDFAELLKARTGKESRICP